MKFTKSLFLQVSRKYSTRYEKYKSLLTPTTEENFKSFLNKIVDDASKKKSYICLPGVKDHILETAEYNRKVGNNPSSIIMLHSYNIMEGSASLLETKEKHQAFVLAWAIEMLQSYNILEDRKRAYSSKLETVSVPDNANLLRSFLYDMLEDSCKGYPYRDILQLLFHKSFLHMSIGNVFDNYTTSKGKANKFKDFNLKTYETLCEYKTAYNTFKLPFFIASHISGKSDKQMNNYLDKMGSYFGKLYQMQDEFEDCFGAESQAFRSCGTNIQEGKCTWLAVQALQRCTPAQRLVFNTCYGSSEPAHVERIKLLYEQLKIPQAYREEEGALCESIMQMAESSESGLTLDMFSKLLDAMFQKNCDKVVV